MFMVLLAVMVSLFVVEVPYLTMELLTETSIRYNNTTAHCEMYTPEQVLLARVVEKRVLLSRVVGKTGTIIY